MNRSLVRRAIRPRRLTLAVAFLVPIVAASCSVAPPSASVALADPSRGPTGTPAATPSSATAEPSVPATPPPSPSPSAALPGEEPPAARLAAEGGDPVVGQLGSFTWGDGGSDSPWLPGAPVTVGAGEPLTVVLADGPPVSRWTARRVRAAATGPAGAIAVGSGAGRIAFDAPASGSWTVEVSVTFANGLGSASYAWRLDIR